MHKYVMGNIKYELLLDPYNSIGKERWDLMPCKDKIFFSGIWKNILLVYEEMRVLLK